MIYGNLCGKIAVFDGDSISEGNKPKGQTPWADRIGENNKMTWKNYSVGGGTVTAEVYKADGKPRHWISGTIDTIKKEFDTVDYFVVDGGTNDADLLIDSPERFGELDPVDFSGDYDTATFTGALETLFFKAISYYPTAKICYIVAQKMRELKEPEPIRFYKERRRYFDRAVEVCRKWGIPCLDLWETAPLNPFLRAHYDPDLTPEENENQGYLYIDGQHLTSHGYKTVTPIIERFMESL